MSEMKKNVKSIIILIAVLALFYFTSPFLFGGSFVPENFIAARQRGAVIAKDIVQLTGDSLANLDEISAQDRQYNFGKALSLVHGELDQAKKSRLKAIKLTEELDRMARAASGIKPTKARNLVMEAVGNEVSLISHLIVYNDILNGLLQTLDYKFSGDIRYDVEDVQNLIKSMNKEAKEINNLNGIFNQKMGEFDELVK